MKKWVSLLILLTLFAFLVACGDDGEQIKSNNNGNVSEDNTSQVDSENPGNSDEEVTLTIASWSFGTEGDINTNRLLLEAFMEEYPNITVEIDESIADPWNDSLATAASGGTLPDVFQLNNVPIGLANDWLLDISEFTNNDEDFAKLPDSVIQSITYGDEVFAAPNSQHMLGYYVNKDLFNEANLDVPYLGMSLDEFNEAIRNITNINQGVVGMDQTNAIPEWYPASANEELGWYTFNEEGFHLNSSEFIDGIELAQNINTNGYAYEPLTDDEKANFNGEEPIEVWFNGGIGIKWDGTWALEGFDQQANFEWDFIGIPGERAIVTHDYYGISSATEHPEEAYLLAKWMGFGKDGYMKRVEIVDAEEELGLTGVPLISDDEVLEAYFERVNVPGVQQVYENIENAVVEPFKTTPGYEQARWHAPTGVSVGDESNATIGQLINASISGEINIENYASQIDELANAEYQKGLEAIGQ